MPLPFTILSVVRPKQPIVLQMALRVVGRPLVLVLDRQPVVALAAVAIVLHAHQHPAALQLASQDELQLALAQRRLDVVVASAPRSRGPRA